MHNALDKLTIRPELILVDGNKFHPYNFIPHQCIIKEILKYYLLQQLLFLLKLQRPTHDSIT